MYSSENISCRKQHFKDFHPNEKWRPKKLKVKNPIKNDTIQKKKRGKTETDVICIVCNEAFTNTKAR